MSNNNNNIDTNELPPSLIDIKNHKFKEPIKVITNQGELTKFLRSQQCQDFLMFIQRLGDKVKGCKSNNDSPISESVQKIINMLGVLSGYIDSIPPLQQPMRYGNKAFRTWHAKLSENIKQLHEMIIPSEEYIPAIIELAPYLIDSMGNSTRIDYGTGHELHFVAWMYCLRAIGILKVEDEPAMTLRIFPTYLTLVRKLQTVYGLEPAGTHGVWSLDDYQFIPFVWGGAQLINHPTIKPVSIMDDKIVDSNYQDYLYLGCIKYIKTLKKGPFYEHSRELYNISGAANWEKIHQGMMKKFFDDVMSKVPIIQHFLFGTIIHFSISENK